jgi:hypothetical protein
MTAMLLLGQVWDASAPATVRSYGDRLTETDCAAVETVGEGSDVSEGAREGGTGCRRENEASAEERSIEGEEVVGGRQRTVFILF